MAMSGGSTTSKLPSGNFSNICSLFVCLLVCLFSQGEPGFLGPQGEPGLPGLPGTKVCVTTEQIFSEWVWHGVSRDFQDATACTYLCDHHRSHWRVYSFIIHHYHFTKAIRPVFLLNVIRSGQNELILCCSLWVVTLSHCGASGDNPGTQKLLSSPWYMCLHMHVSQSKVKIKLGIFEEMFNLIFFSFCSDQWRW